MRKQVLVITSVFSLAILAFSFNCGLDKGDSLPDTGDTAQALAALKPVGDCDRLLMALKERAIREMEQKVDQNMEYMFEWMDYCSNYGRGYYGDPDDDGYFANDASSGAPGGRAESGDSASQYSETNNQVAGVDEADFMKNDGGYVYIVAGDEFKIVDAWPPEEAHVIASVPIEGEPKKLFMAEDRALIYSSLDAIPPADDYGYYGYGGECTYGYDCDFTGDGRQLKITVLDITERSQPKLVREIWLSGSYLNARRIGTSVHTAVVFPPISFPELSYWPETLERYWYCDNTYTPWQIMLTFKALKEANRKKIMNADIMDWLPGIKDTRYTDGTPQTQEGLLQSCNNFYESNLPDGQSFLTLMSLDIVKPTDLNATTIIGKPGAVYSSASALYVSSRNQSGYSYYYSDEQPEETSTVHKFNLETEPAGCSYVGSGTVKGRVLNQFSMDESEGYLRMATTTGRVPSPDVHSTVSVLEEKDGKLVVVGKVDNIAPTEDIRSARFTGKRLFIVTFKKTDPLFAIDLSDPYNPTIAGELKIPGFSTYMHLLDKDHLLTIGYDAEDHGNFAYFQGLMLQIFDVSDMTDPRLIHKEIIGTRGSTSDAATNHLAFNYFAPLEMLAIPMTICEDNNGGGSYGTEMTFSGLLVYDVTLDSGFARHGGVSHVDPDTTDYGNCSNWWTRSNSVVKRSIFMDDYVYSVALDLIKIQHLDQMGQDIATVQLVSE